MTLSRRIFRAVLATGAAAVVFAAAAANAATCPPLPYVFVDGTVADALQVDADLASILGCLSDQINITDTTPSVSPTTGALTVVGGVGIGGALNVGGALSLAGIVNLTNTTQSTTTGTGALIVAGGVGIGLNLNVGGAETVTGNLTVGGGVGITGNLTVTGTPTGPTPGSNISTTQFATTAWVNNWYAPLASPPLTGTPTAPTAAYGTDTTQLATTAFVINQAPDLYAGNASTQTGSFTVANGASNDHRLFIFSGTAPGQTATVNALSTYSVDPNFSTGFCNLSNKRWTIASADSGNIFLYPRQCNWLVSNGSALIYRVQQQRYRSPNTTLYVSLGGGCSDSNDGLAAAQPFCHVANALTELITNYDLVGTNPSIQLADGTYTEAIDITGPAGVGWKDGININGNAVTPTNVLLQGSSGSNPVFARDLSIVFLNNLALQCVYPVLPCVISSQNATVDLTNVTFETSTSQTLLQTQAGGHIDLDGGVVLTGNAASFVNSTGPNAWVEATNQSISCGGNTIHFSTGVVVADGTGAGADFQGSNFSGCGSVSGVRAIVADNAELRTGGSCTTSTLGTTFSFLPGSGNQAAGNGGICD